jgi:hypothetical protein
MPKRITAGAPLVVLLAVVAAASASAPGIRVRIHDHTGIALTDVIWTGSRLLYMENTTNTIWAPGTPPVKFATMPRVVEETRCVPAPGRHGFAAGSLYCHSPDNVIYRVDASTGAVTTFARLPDTRVSDGAIAFDTVGGFGYRLLAATGRSGAGEQGGAVYAIDPGGGVTRTGAYASPAGGGAENMVVAPARFGTGGGRVVLTVDAGSHGSLVMMDPRGRTWVAAYLPDGPNPITIVPRRPSAPIGLAAGLYFTDTLSTNVFFAPAADLGRYAGDIIVGTEIKGTFWALAPNGSGFRTRRIPLRPPGTKFNLEGAVFVG